jgi:MFS transporter, FHS family, glucose/mannose:H+ symporter
MVDPKHFNRSALLVTANASMFVFGAVLLLMGSLLPSLRFTYSQAGNLGAFPLVGILVATVLVGPTFDLIGAKPVFAIALGLIAASLILMSTLRSYLPLAASAFTYGFGGGLLNTAANALVAELNASGRASALNLLGFFFSLGAIAAPLSLSSLAGGISALVVLRYLAVLCFLILALVLALRFPSGEKAGSSIGSLLAVLHHFGVWLFAALLFFESGGENCMFVWAGKLVADTLHFNAVHANLALVALSTALGVGRLAAAVILKWLGSQKTVLISALIVILGSLIVVQGKDFSTMVAGMAIIGLGQSAIFPTALGMAGDGFPQNTGTVFGAIMAVALVGGTTGPKLAGSLAGFGVRHVLLIPMIAASAIVLLTGVIAQRTHEQAPMGASVVP